MGRVHVCARGIGREYIFVVVMSRVYISVAGISSVQKLGQRRKQSRLYILVSGMSTVHVCVIGISRVHI